MHNPRISKLLLAIVCASCLQVASLATSSALPFQVAVDSTFDARVARPAYTRQNPRVLFDEAHNNGATAGGMYRPFVDLITSDGYKVALNDRPFSKKTLAGCDILVIVNPSGPNGRQDTAAFTDDECVAVKDWINAGGNLLLIVGHLPFGSAADLLCKKLNLDVTKGHTIDKSNSNQESGDETELLFTRDNGLLKDHAITRGRTSAENINRILTFSGTSLKGPAESTSFLALSDKAIDIMPPTESKPTAPEQGPPDYRQSSAAGRAQGLTMELGKGRVVALSEPAMLTAQVARAGFRFGMNIPGYDNRQLALNIMHWLSGLLK